MLLLGAKEIGTPFARCLLPLFKLASARVWTGPTRDDHLLRASLECAHGACRQRDSCSRPTTQSVIHRQRSRPPRAQGYCATVNPSRATTCTYAPAGLPLMPDVETPKVHISQLIRCPGNSLTADCKDCVGIVDSLELLQQVAVDDVSRSSRQGLVAIRVSARSGRPAVASGNSLARPDSRLPRRANRLRWCWNMLHCPYGA